MSLHIALQTAIICEMCKERDLERARVMLCRSQVARTMHACTQASRTKTTATVLLWCCDAAIMSCNKNNYRTQLCKTVTTVEETRLMMVNIPSAASHKEITLRDVLSVEYYW